MSDEPTQPIEPTRAERPIADEPTAVVPPAAGATRTTYETTEPPRQPPTGGGVSTGVAVIAAVLTALLGLLAGYLLWGTDDDDTATPTEDTVPVEPGADEALVAERDQLAQQVEEQQGQLDDLQAQLDEATTERDEFQDQVDEASGDEVITVEAPDVTGGSPDDAADLADENGWTLVQREVPADSGDPGTVVAQHPEPGTPMIEGSVLVIDVASSVDD